MGRRNFKINISDVTHASSLITSTTIPAPKGSFKWDRFQNGFDPNRKVFVVNAGRRFSHIPSPLLPLLARSFASEKLFGYQVVGNTFLGRETTTCVWWWCTCMRVCVCMDGRTGGLCAILCVRMGKRPEETVGRLHYNNSSSLFHNFSISFALESFWANIFVWSMHDGKRSLSHQKEKYS